MTNAINVDVASDFSRFPAGRFKSDGPFSGESFREMLVAKLNSESGLIVVSLDGAVGYASSFLEEAFGGLVRHECFGISYLRNRICIITDDSSLEAKIWQYIDEASSRR